MRAWQIPLRLSAGAYVLDSGLAKLRADEETAKHLHGFADGAYPFLAAVEPATFARALAVSEVLIGAASLVPAVPARDRRGAGARRRPEDGVTAGYAGPSQARP